MFKKVFLSLLLLMVMPAFSAPVTAPKAQQTQQQNVVYEKINPLEIAHDPAKFLNKKVEFTAKFDKFTTLGLDYKKALRDSQKYVGFLIQRNDIEDHNVPLSELKMFMTRDYAEKFIDMETGDEIKVKGVVFSDALGDGWLDADEIQILKKAPQES